MYACGVREWPNSSMGSALLYSCGLIAHAISGRQWPSYFSWYVLAQLYMRLSVSLFLAAHHYWFTEILSSDTTKRSNLCPSHQNLSPLLRQPEDYLGCLVSFRYPFSLHWLGGKRLGHLLMWFPRAPCNSCGKEMKNQVAKEIYVWLSLLLFLSPSLALSLHHQVMPTIESG